MELASKAEHIETLEEEYTPDFRVIGIYFGTGDPEDGGHHWNFTKVSEDDEDRICTVKEIQKAVIYGGIQKFRISGDNLECEFDDEASAILAINRLKISFDLDANKKTQLLAAAQKIFIDKPYFEIASRFSFKPRWKEELVVTCGDKSFVLDLPMGVLSAYLPTEDVWREKAPAWAKGRWLELKQDLEVWCRDSGAKLFVDPTAHLYAE